MKNSMSAHIPAASKRSKFLGFSDDIFYRLLNLTYPTVQAIDLGPSQKNRAAKCWRSRASSTTQKLIRVCDTGNNLHIGSVVVSRVVYTARAV